MVGLITTASHRLKRACCDHKALFLAMLWGLASRSSVDTGGNRPKSWRLPGQECLSTGESPRSMSKELNEARGLMMKNTRQEVEGQQRREQQINKKKRRAKKTIQKKHDHMKVAKGSFHCGCGQRINSLKDRQSVTCGSCGAVHYGPK